MPRPPARLTAALLALALAACGGPAGDGSGGDPVERGRRLFETAVGGLSCADCHGGTDGLAESRPDWRPSGHPLAGLPTRASLWGGRFDDEGRMVQAALYCAARFQYRVADELGDRGEEDFTVVPTSLDDREALRRFLLTLDGPGDGRNVDRDADVDPVFDLTGDPDRGERVWMAACAVCHGNDARGGLGPSIAGDDALDALTFVEYVRLGALDDADGWMPWYRQDRLSDQELADLAARWAE